MGARVWICENMHKQMNTHRYLATHRCLRRLLHGLHRMWNLPLPTFPSFLGNRSFTHLHCVRVYLWLLGHCHSHHKGK